MSVLISTLPVYTGSAADLRWYIMNNSGQTQTFKFSGYTSPFILTGNSGSSVYSRTSTPTYIEDNTGNNLIWPGETLRLDDYCSGNTIFGTNHYLRTDNNAGDATTNCTIIGNEIFVRRGVGVFIQGQNQTYDRGGITGGYMLGGASNVIQNCTGNASGIIGGQSNRAENYQFQNSTIIGGASNSITNDVQNTSIFGSQSSQVGSTSYGAGIFGGASNVINGGGGAHIVGGYSNNVNTTNCSGIYASRGCNLTNSYEDIGASIWGSWTSTILAGSPLAQIFGGNANTIAGTSPYSMIFGGSGNTISGITNSVMIGTSGRTADASNTTYVENLQSFGGSFQVGSGNIISSTAKNVAVIGNNNNIEGAASSAQMYIGNGFSSSAFGNYALHIGNGHYASGSYNISVGDNTIEQNANYSICVGNSGGSQQHKQWGTDVYNLGVSNQLQGITGGFIFGKNHTISNGGWGGIFAGIGNSISSSGNYNTIIGGQNNSITGTTSGSTILSSNGRTATRNDATFVENLVVFNYAGLNFADDTAAAAGGVVLGQVYHTGGVLKIRIV